MKAFFVIFLFAASWSTTAAEVENEVEVPKIFEDGEVAEAADFNANFNYLEDKITALNEGAPWIKGNLNGSKIVEVDCSIIQRRLLKPTKIMWESDNSYW